MTLTEQPIRYLRQLKAYISSPHDIFNGNRTQIDDEGQIAGRIMVIAFIVVLFISLLLDEATPFRFALLIVGIASALHNVILYTHIGKFGYTSTIRKNRVLMFTETLFRIAATIIGGYFLLLFLLPGLALLALTSPIWISEYIEDRRAQKKQSQKRIRNDGDITMGNASSQLRKLKRAEKRIRNNGDIMKDYARSQLSKLNRERTKIARNYAKENNMKLRDAISEINNMLVNHQQGESVGSAPPFIEKAVNIIKGIYMEQVVGPIIDKNKGLMKQGFLFEMPDALVDDGVLSNEHRREIERDLPNFRQFIRLAEYQTRKKGHIQGVVRDKHTGKVYAVRVRGNVFIDPKTGKPRPFTRKTVYELISPLGEEFEADSSVLDGENSDVELIVFRDPQQTRWTGDRRAAGLAWDQEISDNPRPDIVREYFAEAGIELPDEFTFRFSRKANIEQWAIRDQDGREIYRVRRMVPAENTETDYEVSDVYSDFANKLMVYDPNQVRNPIFIYRGRVPFKVWEPLENYYPHMIHWRNMSPMPGDGRRHKKYLEYATAFADANNIDLTKSQNIIAGLLAESLTRSFGNLEQDREYNYPNFDTDWFKVWEAYFARVRHRLKMIDEFGQNNELLDVMLDEFLTGENIGEQRSPEEKGVLKLGFIHGFFDLAAYKYRLKMPFEKQSGEPIAIDPNSGMYHNMTAGDWEALVEAEILTVQPDETYMPTTGGLWALKYQEFSKGGALDAGIRRRLAAEDVVKNLKN